MATPIFAAANRTKLEIIQETDFGVIPVTGNPKALRLTGESLDYDLSQTESAEIRDDRQISDLVIVGAAATGGFNIEWSFAEYDQLLEAVLQGTWSHIGTAGVSAAIPTSATFAAGALTAGAATTGANLFTRFRKGQYVRFAGSTIAGQNIIAQVSKTIDPTATVLTFEGTPFTAVTGNGGVAVTVSGSQVSNGTTERSFTIQRVHSDIAQFFAFRGMTANKLSLNFASGSLVNGSFEFMGRDVVRGGATQLPGITTASRTFDIMNAVKGVGFLAEHGVVLTDSFIKSIKLDIGNNLYARDAIGILGAASIGSGSIDVSGSVEIYLKDGAIYDRFINGESSSIQFNVTDGSGNGYTFNLPKLKYQGPKINAGGKNTDVMFTANFKGLMDPVTGKTILIDRFGVA